MFNDLLWEQKLQIIVSNLRLFAKQINKGNVYIKLKRPLKILISQEQKILKQMKVEMKKGWGEEFQIAVFNEYKKEKIRSG